MTEGKTPTSLTWRHNESYYRKLCSEAPVCLGVVTTDPIKGKCLLATCDIKSGEKVLVERALTWSQNMDEFKSGKPVCVMCLRSLETPSDIVTRVIGNPSLANGLPEVSSYSVTAKVPCRHSCGQHYCSLSCEAAGWERSGHSELCGSKMGREARSALKAFHQDSWVNGGIDYSDTAYVALKTVSMTLADHRGPKKIPLLEAYDRFDMGIKVPLEKFTFLYLLDDNEGLTADTFAAYEADPFAHAVVRGAVDSDVPRAEMLKRASKLMATIFNMSEAERKFFSASQISNLMGMILLNGQERTPNSPYHEYQEAAKKDPNTKSKLQEFHRQCKASKPNAVKLFAGSTRGQAMYRIGSCFNHSCKPCVQITYDENRNDETLVAVALRDILSGEELCISYIDEELPYRNRQLHLFDHYLFKCQCEKCVKEAEDKGGIIEGKD